MEEKKIVVDRGNKPSASGFKFLEQITPSEVVGILSRRIHWVVATTVLVFSLTAITVWRWPAMYRSETLILVDPQKIPERYVNSTVSMDVAGRLNTISQQIMSATRLQRIIDNFNLYKERKGRSTQEEITEQMRSDTKVEVVRSAEISRGGLGAFRISYQGRNPVLTAQVCNQVASLFIEENLKVREQQAEGTSEFLDNQLGTAKKKLEEQEQKLRDFKLRHIGELPEQANANMATMGRLQAQLQAETESLNRARQQEVYIQSLLASMPAPPVTPPPAAPAEEREPMAPPAPTSEALARLKHQRALMETQMSGLMTRFHADHPDLRRARAELEAVNRQVAAEEKSLSAAVASAPSKPAPRPRVASPAPEPAKDPTVALRSQLRVIAQEIENRQAQMSRVSGQIGGYQGRLDQMPLREQQIVEVIRDYEMSKGFYQSLLDKKMSADMSADLEKRQKSERFTILDPARVPERPFRPNRPALSFGGLLAGLGLGIVLAFAAEARANCVHREQEVTALGLRVLAHIPPLATPEEVSVRRRTLVLRWAAGTLATMAATAVGGGIIVLITRRMFF